jgi:hypothetical protein
VNGRGGLNGVDGMVIWLADKGDGREFSFVVMFPLRIEKAGDFSFWLSGTPISIVILFLLFSSLNPSIGPENKP